MQPLLRQLSQGLCVGQEVVARGAAASAFQGDAGGFPLVVDNGFYGAERFGLALELLVAMLQQVVEPGGGDARGTPRAVPQQGGFGDRQIVGPGQRQAAEECLQGLARVRVTDAGEQVGVQRPVERPEPDPFDEAAHFEQSASGGGQNGADMLLQHLLEALAALSELGQKRRHRLVGGGQFPVKFLLQGHRPVDFQSHPRGEDLEGGRGRGARAPVE